MRSAGIGAILGLAMVSSAWGYGYMGLGLGSGVFQASARCGGMGEVALLCEESPLAAALNPAMLAGLEKPQATLTYRAASLNEQWAFPVYDSFDAVLGYNTYSANSNLYHDFSIGFASGSLEQVFGTSFAVALVPAYDFRYDYEEELLDRNSTAQPPDRVIARDFIRGDGEIRSLSCGLGMTLVESLAVGFGLDYLFGKHDLDAGIVFLDESRIPWPSKRPDTSETYSASGLSGKRFTVAAMYALGERLDFAAVYKSGVELDGHFSGTATDEFGFGGNLAAYGSSTKIEYPASYAFGVSLRPRNTLLTVIEADVVFSRWSQVEDTAGVGRTTLDDTYEWHIGVEHVFYNQRPLRFGFLYRPSPDDKETSEAAMTAGTGFNVAGFDIDLAAKVGWREYREPDLFRDDIFGAELRGSTDLVKDTAFGGLVTITRRF